MSVGALAGILVAILGVVAIAYVWSRVASEPGTMSDGTPGSVMDGGEDVRRIDLGTHTYVAQRAAEQLKSEGYNCRSVSLEQGAFGIGLGDRHYLVYNAEDETRVREVVDQLLDGAEQSYNELE